MKTDNPILTKSKAFAVRTVKLCQYLQEKKKEFILSKQLLRSGTSIGANVREAIYAQSKSDFTAKLNIALKESAETEYWLELLHETGYLTPKQFQNIYFDSCEVSKLLIAIIKSSRAKKK